jgi:S-disulfanyl-L-cysteine oxidoreductase SoxD
MFIARTFLSIFFLVAFAAAAQSQPKSIWQGSFTSAQADRGKAAFEMSCARCHNLALIGSERGPAIKGSAFLSHWDKGSVGDIFIKIRDTMPEGGSGTVKDEIKLDILSYILQQNGFPAGNDELKLDVAALGDIRLARKGIWDGVFTTAQAERGKAALLQNGCNGCHGADLSGDRGPSLKGERFIAEWENGSLGKLFTKIRDTMPPFNAEQVTPATKVDIISYLLQVNGFPSGSSTLNIDDLETIPIIKRGADAAGPANFTLVESIGCLAQSPDKKWILTKAGEPSATKEETSTPASLQAAQNQPLGSRVLELISVSSSFKPETHLNQKVLVRGLLYRDTKSIEVNLTSIDSVAATCVN